MSNKKISAKQKREQAAKQQKTELIVICCIAAAVILAIILVVLLGGTVTEVNQTSGGVSSNHVHDENCSHDTQPVIQGGGDGATLETATATHYATIEIEDYGTIKAELYGNTAPITVENFVSLAESGFYDGLTFHRIKEGFMMQGGDPNGNGTGGSAETITGEFSANGITNNLLHKRGVLSMARATAYDSASSQFFIMHEDSAHLDGQYAAFGMVIEGLDVVDAVCKAAQPTDDNGTIPADQQPVIKSITIEKIS